MRPLISITPEFYTNVSALFHSCHGIRGCFQSSFPFCMNFDNLRHPLFLHSPMNVFAPCTTPSYHTGAFRTALSPPGNSIPNALGFSSRQCTQLLSGLPRSILIPQSSFTSITGRQRSRKSFMITTQLPSIAATYVRPVKSMPSHPVLARASMWDMTRFLFLLKGNPSMRSHMRWWVVLNFPYIWSSGVG